MRLNYIRNVNNNPFIYNNNINNQIIDDNNINNQIIVDNNEKLEISPEDIYNRNEVENMEDLITCPICLNILFSPVQCNICNKCFCKICIKNYNDSRNKCPFRCINPKYLENKFVNNVLSILKFKCKNGCNQIINYDNLEKHYEEDCDKIDFKTKYKELLIKYNALKNVNNNMNYNNMNNNMMNNNNMIRANNTMINYNMMRNNNNIMNMENNVNNNLNAMEDLANFIAV